jgi:hypothetical protein
MKHVFFQTNQQNKQSKTRENKEKIEKTVNVIFFPGNVLEGSTDLHFSYQFAGQGWSLNFRHLAGTVEMLAPLGKMFASESLPPS